MLTIPRSELEAVVTRKHGDIASTGWSPRLRWRFGYFTPDEVYEATVFRLVTPRTDWLDVGCGRDLFPADPANSEVIARRCRLLVGVDPSPNVLENPYLHRAHQTTIEDFSTDETFDLVTMRMVAEHISRPDDVLRSLASLVRRGGTVVVYTVNKYAPISVVSALVPFKYHHAVKRIVWGTEEKDTFPVAYLMNTRSSLKRIFQAYGFAEEGFAYLDDCRALAKWKPTCLAELSTWRALRSLGVHYPETCLLGVYRKG